MPSRELAAFTAACRIGIGAGFVAYPGLAMRPWLGSEAGRPAVKLLARALGARDLVLGVGTMSALEDGLSLRRWLRAALVADAADFLVTLLEHRHLPDRGRQLVLAIAGAGVAMGGVAALGPGGTGPAGSSGSPAPAA
jgi:hypothetical protein